MRLHRGRTYRAPEPFGAALCGSSTAGASPSARTVSHAWRAPARALAAVRGLRLCPYTGSSSKPGFCSGPTMETINDGARLLGDPGLPAGRRNRVDQPRRSYRACRVAQPMGWSLDEAARQLGISRRACVYLEAGLTSRGRNMPFIPRVTELACAELGRRHGSPIRRAG